jgi:hypothetical protein
MTDGRKISGRKCYLFVSRCHRELCLQSHGDSIHHGRFPSAAFEIGNLLFDVVGWQTHDICILRAARPVGAVTKAARVHIRLAPLSDWFRLRRMIARMPVGRIEKIANLRECQR